MENLMFERIEKQMETTPQNNEVQVTKQWEDKYAGFVIREERDEDERWFLVDHRPTEDRYASPFSGEVIVLKSLGYHVKREEAARFTKAQALAYIAKHETPECLLFIEDVT